VEARLTIDWRTPWFEPWRGTGEKALQAWRSKPLHEALASTVQAPPESTGAVRFVPQDAMPPGEAYEAFVFRTRTVPTRDNPHDFFNALAWLRFSQLKQRLNAIQAGEIARDGIGATRGAVRDAITLLDENGVFLEGPPEIREALAARQWGELFVGLRPLWAGVTVTVFGHAMLEKLLAPRKDLTAHVWMGPAEIDAQALAAKPLAPLPLMGIPGWCAENQNFSFYDDSLVFRAAGQRTKRQQPVRHPAP
jgi:hypothetical protein